MVVWSYYHYDIGAIINSKSGMDTCVCRLLTHLGTHLSKNPVAICLY